MASQRVRGGLAIVAAAALWGTGGTVAGYLFTTGIKPAELVAVRSVVTALCLGAVTAFIGRPAPHPPMKWPLIITYGLAVAAANGFLFFAIDRLPVAVALVLQNLAPAFVVAWLVTTGRTRARPVILVGVAAALLGVVLVVELPSKPINDVDLVGVFLGIATAAAVATFTLVGKSATELYGSVRSNAHAFAVASVAWIIFHAPSHQLHIFEDLTKLPAVAFVSVFGTFLPFLLFAWGTARVGAQAGAVCISLEPLFSAVLAWVWLGQLLSGMQIMGAIILLTAVFILQRFDQANGNEPSDSESSTRRRPAGTAS